VEPYLVSSSVEAILAQRLVRRICKHCKTALTPDEVDKISQEFGDIVPAVLYKGVGCRQCLGTGYRGRQGCFEMMPMTDEIRQLVMDRAPAHQIRKVAVAQGMTSLREDGWRLAGLGITSVDEVIQNTKDETTAVASDRIIAAVTQAAVADGDGHGRVG
jgi:type II secretory ATPase GspE/PulE/Tfp pilus assembly ATPase PilB-like protein